MNALLSLGMGVRMGMRRGGVKGFCCRNVLRFQGCGWWALLAGRIGGAESPAVRRRVFRTGPT